MFVRNAMLTLPKNGARTFGQYSARNWEGNKIKTLSEKYNGQTCWIVGKGPSLEFLTTEHVGLGPVITINQAVLKIEELGIKNPVYSMQKDGGEYRDGKATHELIPDCAFSGIKCNNSCEGMVRPQKAVLLIHEHESKFCFPDYPRRIIFDCMDLLGRNEFSLIMAIQISRIMGCDKIVFVSCDLHDNGDSRTFVHGQGTKFISEYINQARKFKKHLMGIGAKYEFVTPQKAVV